MMEDHSLPLSRLTRAGIERYRSGLDALNAGDEFLSESEVHSVLTESDTAKVLSAGVSIDGDRTFENKGGWAAFIDRVFDDAGLDPQEVRYDVGLWNWLSLLYHRQILPTDSDGSFRRPGPTAGYALDPGSQPRSFYRHRLASPYWALKDHGSDAGGLLCSALNVWPDGHEQLYGAQERYMSPAVVEVWNKLYHDPKASSGWKERAVDTEKDRYPGTIRRFIIVWQQLESTYDLLSITGAGLEALLPDEFKPWLAGKPTRAELLAWPEAPASVVGAPVLGGLHHV
jgi:hypothetical protein